MPKRKITITSIDSGWGTGAYDQTPGTFNASIAIDPDSQGSGNIQASGALSPTAYTKFSATKIAAKPLWITANPKTANSFVYDNGGGLNSFDSAIAMRNTDEAGTSFPINFTGGAGNGLAYYNNFIYVFEAADVSQYGGMDQGASIAATENVWTGIKFGMAALTNTTYPALRAGFNVTLPNHPAFTHSDNALYFGDVVAGQGVIHKIKTIKTTIQGDTNSGSVFNALDLPFGYYPTAISNWGTDLVIAAVQTSGSADILQGSAALFLWDTFADSFYRQIPVQDALISALLNTNGHLYVWSGNANSGYRVSEYTGGDSLSQFVMIQEGCLPFPGGVASINNRLLWGSNISYPADRSVVWAWGSRDNRVSEGLQNVVCTTSAGTFPTTTALKVIQQFNDSNPRVIVGWSDGTTQGLDKFDGSGVIRAVWRSPMYTVGGKFVLEKIIIPLDETVQANFSVVPKIYTDNNFTTAASTLPTISTVLYSGKQTIVYKRPEINVQGVQNFMLELNWSSTRSSSVNFPIVIEYQDYEDFDSA